MNVDEGGLANTHQIAGLKDSLEVNEPTSPEPVSPLSELKGPDLLMGNVHRISRSEILAALPPRPVCNALVLSFLNMPDMGSTGRLRFSQCQY